MFCGLTARNGLPSSASAAPSASLPFWICAEIAKATKLSRIQPKIPSRTQRTQRRFCPVRGAASASSGPTVRLLAAAGELLAQAREIGLGTRPIPRRER